MKHNIGIDIIRILACYSVVAIHFGGRNLASRWAVPAFVFIAFYLSAARLESNSLSVLRRRVTRLFVPYAFWGAAGFAVSFLIGTPFALRDIFLQMVFGTPVAPHLYYMILCILFSILVFLVEKLPARASLAIYLATLVLCFVCQYSGVNHFCFDSIEGLVKYTPGRIAELFPAAIAGLIFSKLERRGFRDEKVAMSVAFALFCVAAVSLKMKTPASPQGFGYEGLPLFAAVSSLCAGMILFFKNRTCRLKQLPVAGSLTPGIYYMHLAFGTVLTYFTGIENSFLTAFAVFICCAVCTWTMMKFRLTAWMVK